MCSPRRTRSSRLPARKEGIIPGAANMRLPRFVGDRIARQAIQYERRLECDSPEGRLICDEIVEAGGMDAAIERVVRGLTSSGVVSAASNRRAFRITQEPLDMFREYFAVYAREQAYCHFSPALIANLEKVLERSEPEAVMACRITPAMPSACRGARLSPSAALRSWRCRQRSGRACPR